MMTSAHAHACAGSSTVSRSASALARDALPGASPTQTSTPLSRRFNAWACPCDPYPSTATRRPRTSDRSASAS